MDVDDNIIRCDSLRQYQSPIIYNLGASFWIGTACGLVKYIWENGFVEGRKNCPNGLVKYIWKKGLIDGLRYCPESIPGFGGKVVAFATVLTTLEVAKDHYEGHRYPISHYVFGFDSPLLESDLPFIGKGNINFHESFGGRMLFGGLADWWTSSNTTQALDDDEDEDEE